MTGPAQAAIRRRIRIPLCFDDGYSTVATVVSFTGLTDAQQHVALELGRPAAAGLPLVRLHSECLTGDVFGSQRCDCGPQLREAVERITKHGGYVLYLRQEGPTPPTWPPRPGAVGMICFRGVLNAPPGRTGTPTRSVRHTSGPRADDRHPRASGCP